MVTQLQAYGSISNGMVTNNVVLANSFAQLTPAKVADIAATQQLSMSTLTATLKTAGLDKAQRGQIYREYNVIQAKRAATVATKAQTAATGGLTAAFRGLGAVMKAHPLMTLFTILSIALPIHNASKRHTTASYLGGRIAPALIKPTRLIIHSFSCLQSHFSRV